MTDETTVVEAEVPQRRTPQLFVATPMYGGLCHGTFATSLLMMVNTFTRARMGFTFAHMMNESLITRARDSLAYDFLEMKDSCFLPKHCQSRWSHHSQKLI